MSVTIGNNGGILVHCHAGCSPEAIVGAMGLRMSDLMKDAPGKVKGKKKSTKSGEAPLPSFKAPKKKRGRRRKGE